MCDGRRVREWGKGINEEKRMTPKPAGPDDNSCISTWLEWVYFLYSTN